MLEYTIIMAAHNEEKYIKRALLSIITQSLKPKKIVVILDRCTDKTPLIVRKMEEKLRHNNIIFQLIKKDEKKWIFSYAENLEIGRRNATTEYVAILDADVVIPPRYFEILAKFLDAEKTFAVSGKVMTYCNKILCKMVSLWERTYEYGIEKWPRGCALLINNNLLDKIGGFRDVPTPDTDILIRAVKKGYRIVITSETYALHVRELTLRYSVNRQLKNGIHRFILKYSFVRTLLHSIVRVRPFVMIGYIAAMLTYKLKPIFREQVRYIRYRIGI